MDNNMIQMMMQMMAQQNQMMTMLMQQMSQPQPDPVQVAQPQIPNQQQIIQDSNSAASASVQEIADLKAEITKLKAQLAQAESEKANLKAELTRAQSKVSEAQGKLNQLKVDITKVEAYEGESFEEKVDRISGMSGQDYYDEVLKDEPALSNQEKHDLVKAFKDDQEATPMVNFETGITEYPESQVAKFWREHQELQRNKEKPKMREVEADRKFDNFGKAGFGDFL